MASKSNRALIKGPLRPPRRQASNLSYTQVPASKNEVLARIVKGKEIHGKCDFTYL